MHIDCGTTTEHRVRLGLFLGMCIVFAAYFGYDGMWGYPAKNLGWAKQNIPIAAEQKANILTNPRVLRAALVRVDELAKSPAGATDKQVQEILGEPAAVVENKAEPEKRDCWYVGPAACAKIQYVSGKVKDVGLLQNINKSEEDIWLQKVLGAILGLASVGVAIYYIRIMTMRTIVDEQGVSVKGRRVAWNEMKGLDSSDYQRKGWLDLLYTRNGEEQAIRLDNYHIQHFHEVVNAICERQGYPMPIRSKHADAEEDEEASEKVES